MNTPQRNTWVAGLLLGVWLLVAGWQWLEHRSVVATAQSDLRGRSHEIASTLSAVTRAFQFRGTIVQNNLNMVLNELVRVRTNALVKSSGLLAVGLLNDAGDPVVTAGNTNLIARDAINAGEQNWSESFVTFVLPVEGPTNAPVVVAGSLPGSRDTSNELHHDAPRHERPPESAAINTNLPPPPPDGTNRPGMGEHSHGRGRPPWLRWMTEADFKAYAAKHELHGLVLAMSTDNYRAVCTDDLWLRCMVSFFAAISALVAGFAWRNLARNADLQIRLVRASELNSHLKELNLAAAGLAHETRNPLNIIRGQAQMISRLPEAAPEVREKSKTIVDETDKVTAQLTEFINYSRPREVRRTRVDLAAAANEIARTLGHDIEEKTLTVEVGGDALVVDADEQLLRQVIFNLFLNAIQAAAQNGKIQILVQRQGVAEAALEVRDDGPGVPAENRREIFKPYFTTHQKGTGLGLAVVQQIVHAHGWEIVCVNNEPHGAVFRITHLKVAA